MHAYLNIAISAARKAGTIITRNLEKLDSLEIFEKGINDLVTMVDKMAEEIIIDTILKAYPHHGILGEETGAHPGNEYLWIIDPLDGTMNYTHGFSQFAVSIALLYKGTIEHAVIYDPVSQDLFTASKGAGAQLNNRRIRVSNKDHLRDALIGTAFPFRIKEAQVGNRWDSNMHAMHSLIYDHYAETRKIGSAALNLAYVAAGRLDGFFESALQKWDIAAGILLVKEAGGFVTDYHNEVNMLDSGQIIAGTRKIHVELVRIVEKFQVT